MPFLLLAAVVFWIWALLPSGKASFQCQACKQWFTVPKKQPGAGAASTTAAPAADTEPAPRTRVLRSVGIGLGVALGGIVLLGVIGALMSPESVPAVPDVSTTETDQQVQRPATPEADTPATNASSFTERLNAGASCQELFALRTAVDPSAPQIPGMNAALREIGCFSSSSVRTR